MRRHIILGFLFVFVFSFILGSLPSAVLADNKGTVVRDPNGTFLSVKFTVTSSAHSTGTVYRTTGLKIWIGPYYAFFDQAYLTSKGFYSSSTTDTVDFTASEIALRSGASVQQIRAAADDFYNGINLGAQIKILQNGVVMATIEEKEQVAPVFNQYGLGAYIAAAETRWGYAYDPVGASRTLTIQIEGQGSTTPAGSKAPGTVHKNMSGSVSLFASPADGWKFAQWVDVTGGIVQFSTNPNTSVYMDKDKTIRAVFIPNTAPPDGKKEYLTVVPCTYTLFEGEYKRFSAFHHKADGSSQEVTNSSEWSVSNSNIARLSAITKGELWGLKKGFVILKAQYKGMEATADVTVIPEPVPPPPNYAPKADFTISNPSPVEGEKVGLFDNSTHEGSKYGEEIVRWDWNIEKIGSSTDRNTTATWNEVGTYKITLRVEDQDGDSDSCTKSVVVGPALPAAVITTSTDHIIIGREIHIDGDESTAAMGRDIKWDEMEWKFYNPSNSLAYEYTGRYPLGKGTSGEKDLTNSVLNKAGNWKITLKVKDTNDNESEITERIIHIYPDKPPIADFWLASEAIRYSYQGYDLTVRDLSTAATPDASLGDEIYERSWVLYYDTNNDGICTGPEDETIYPGDKGKAAEIIQVSANDPRPLIRFNKTGRYQLELTVKEHYEAWGEINEGLSANTDNKTLAEKQIMVINLAPTVAFDIKKKTPVDVQFAVDYSVSDEKYNSLLSADAGFKGELTGAHILPNTGMQKVAPGDISQGFYTAPICMSNTNVTGFTQELEPYYNFTQSSVANAQPLAFNMINTLTGEIKQASTIVKELNDGTFYRGYYKRDYYDGYYEQYGSTRVGFDKVDSNFNVLTPRTHYETIMEAAIPQNTNTWRYLQCMQSNVNSVWLQQEFLRDGSVFLWYRGYEILDGRETGHNKHFLVKFNPDMTKAWEKQIADYTNSAMEITTIDYLGQFEDTEFLIFKTQKKEYLKSINSCFTVSIKDGSINNLHVDSYLSDYTWGGTHLPQYSLSTNGKYLICATFNKIETCNSAGIVDVKYITGLTKGDGPNEIISYNGENIVFYQDLQWTTGGPEYVYLYKISSNGLITLEKQFTELWPGDYPPLEWSNSGIIVTVADKIIGVKFTHGDDSGETICCSILNPDFNILWTEGPIKSGAYNGPIYNYKPISINNKFFGYQRGRSVFDGSRYVPVNKTSVYMLNGALYLNADSITVIDNGSFLARNQLQEKCYNYSGTLIWTKNISESDVFSQNSFAGFLLLSTKENGKPITQLIEPNTGSVIRTIYHEYFWNDNDTLICYGINGSGQRDGTLRGFGQLQGLQYLKQAIENHNWDSDKCNVVVSVIDGDGFKDFEGQKDSILSLLQAHNLKLAVISPPTGLSKSQAGQMIAKSPEGGWWIQTADDMSIPLSDLAKKIIKAVDEDRGADNIVLVGQDAALRANYQDPEEDPATMMTWSFTHDPDKLGDYELVEKADISTLHDTSKTVVPEENQTTLDLTFDQAGTYKVYCKAQDRPNTTEAYREHEKAGNKWSNQDAYITVIAHYKPVASFTITDTTVNKNVPLSIIDNSYDPDLYNPISQATTDPLNQKGLRCWQWQYKKPDGTWESYIRYDNAPPAIYAAAGTYQIRLRVQDVFGAWSDWTETKSFNVVNRPPVADFIVNPNPSFTKLSTTITDKSYDPDGEPIVEYKWEIQKASDQTDIFIHTTPDPFGYTWEDTGSYRVKLTVKDPEGATGTAEKIVVVNEVKPPIARISVPNPVYSGEISLMDGRASTAEAPGSTLEWAYWQYKKPGQDWSDTHTQIRGGNFNLPQERWLMFPIYPADNELGQWAVRLVVVDSLGQSSAPAEKTFTVTEGWEITGQIIPEVGERGRNMRIQAYAHRKGKPNEKYQIDSMKAELAYLDAACTKSGRAVAEGIETLNMPYDASKADFRVTYMVREKIYETNRWPADGMYQIKVIGQKGTTRKEIVLPFSIKGNIHQRFYIQTRSW